MGEKLEAAASHQVEEMKKLERESNITTKALLRQAASLNEQTADRGSHRNHLGLSATSLKLSQQVWLRGLAPCRNIICCRTGFDSDCLTAIIEIRYGNYAHYTSYKSCLPICGTATLDCYHQIAIIVFSW